MSAFPQTQPQASSSTPSVPIRGRGASRMLGNALRGAGMAAEQGMELDGGVGGRRRGAGRSVVTNARAGPLDQTGRHRGRDATPYAKPANTMAGRELLPGGGRGGRGGGGGGPSRRGTGRPHDGRRNPEGTPDMLKGNTPDPDLRRKQHSKLNELLRSDDMKHWLQSRLIAPGTLDLTAMHEDAWLKEQGILSLSDKNAPPNAGHVLWRLIDKVLQEEAGSRILTLSLANNRLASLHQLSKLPMCLPHLRALDLSNNPIASIHELRALQAAGEQKGKLSLGAGSLKSLVELNLEHTRVRDDMCKTPEGAERYKHDIMQRFPGLLMLDRVNLLRIVYPIERQPKIKRPEDERKALAAQVYSFPVDVLPSFFENEGVAATVNQFCAKFFTTFDTDRVALALAYTPTATVSFSCNTLPARSALAADVARTRSARPNPVSFEPWLALPGRNFFRGAASLDARWRSLKTPAAPDFAAWATTQVPQTRHPLADAAKWNIDAWILDGDGASTRIMVVVAGEFQEMPSGTYRSFTRTFTLVLAPPGQPAALAGWPAVAQADIMVVHSYLGTGAFDHARSILTPPVVLVAPSAQSGLPAAGSSAGLPTPIDALALPSAPAVTAAPAHTAPAAPAPAAPEAQEQAVQIVRARTGMNDGWSRMCLAQNEWDIERALANFLELKPTIPPEAYV
ncbi:nuclear mRNA export, poly(A)+RNA binding protein [Cryptotrichosporon argae]